MFRVLLVLTIILIPLNLSAISFVDLQNKDNYTKVYSNQDKSVYVNKNYANIKTNESRQQEVESEFYEVKRMGKYLV
ncbi:hypothetical protein [Veillonella sp.]|uniref:hypothetical protein n=1 Tax=Veillonella sp. TaxID=1926307 RepID=UPI0025CC6D9B|nr:hypothetical protein [Veillonella sp.]